MNNLVIWSPILFGAVIGWLVVYFIRKYKEFTPRCLVETAGVFIGGVGFCSLALTISIDIGFVVIQYYILGVALGFFGHWLFQFVLVLVIGKDFTNKANRYEMLSSCGLTIKEMNANIDLCRKADQLDGIYNMWDRGLLDAKSLIEVVKQLEISKVEYFKMSSSNSIINSKIKNMIESQNLLQYFIDE